jgi:hypothetical protein
MTKLWIPALSAAVVALCGACETECGGVSASDDFGFENSTFCAEMAQVVIADYDNLEILNVPQASRIKGSIRIQRTSLVEIHLPNVQDAALFDGEIVITDNPLLRVVRLGSLTNVGEAAVKRPITIATNPSLQEVDLGSLETASVVGITQMRGTLDAITPTLELSRLREATERLDIVSNDILDLDLSSLESAPVIDIRSNTELETFDLSALRSVSDSLTFSSNGVPDSDICPVVEQLDAPPANLGVACE